MDEKSDNLFLIGFMGVGKSTIAKALAEEIGATYVEMDEVISNQQEMPISDIFDEYGENYFRNVETDLLKELQEKTNQVVSCGGGIVLRDENIEIMRSCGKVILLTADPETIYERVKENKDRPLLNDNMSVEYIEELLKDRKGQYKKAADLTISTDRKDVDEIVSEIRRKLD